MNYVARTDEIKAAYASGDTMQEIANRIGCTRPRIGQLLKAAGVDTKKLKPIRPAPSDPSERWLPVEGWNYEVSNLGNVRRSMSYRNTVKSSLRLCICSGGYLGFTLFEPARPKKTALVHDLMAKAFLGPRPSPRHLVAHFDGDPLNNRIENLRWATYEENEDDKRRHGRLMIGERNHQAKCTEDDVRAIRSSNEVLSAIARRFGISPTVAWKIRTHRAWKHIA